MKLMGAGSIGMFLITVLGVSFFEFRSRKITSSDEVKQGLGLTVIGTVPANFRKVALDAIAEQVRGTVAKPSSWSRSTRFAPCFCTRHGATTTRVIMVTSAVGGEGKTSLSSQLAAQHGPGVEEDAAHRTATSAIRGSHKIFDLPQEPGLSEVLRGELTATDAVRSTPLSRLWVLPAGHWGQSRPFQALAQDNVRTILEELKQQYDFIILDSCPVSAGGGFAVARPKRRRASSSP